MFRTAWTLMTIRGVPVRLHISLLLILPFIAVGFAARDIPALLAQVGVDPEQLILGPTFIGVALAVALFVAVTLHELGHALTALAQGAEVKGITLMILGGLTEIEHEDATPGQEFRMAAAGPAVNLVLAALCWGLAHIEGLWLDAYLSLQIFFGLNLVLALFNLVPAFPLDGGRMLRAGLRLRMDRARATQAATRLGRFLAIVGMVLGVLHNMPMLAVVAFLVFMSAGAEATRVGLGPRLEGLEAHQAMTNRVVSVYPFTEASGVARHLLMSGAHAAVVCEPGRTFGVLLPQDLRGVAPDRAADTLIEGAPLRVTVDDDLSGVVAQMQRRGVPALVFDHANSLVGVVTLEAAMRAADLRTLADGLEAAAARLADDGVEQR